jgi:glyoxylase-like metal-dependent hydrolase (beta-lactamase superfamily II)
MTLKQQGSWFGAPHLNRPLGRIDRLIDDGDVVEVGATSLKFLSTPGHTPGMGCFYDDHDIFVGDTLFAGSIGRTDLMGDDYDALIRSVMDKLMGLPGDTDVVPGHGHPTTIARESATNPFLVPFNEPDTDWWNQDGIPIKG